MLRLTILVPALLLLLPVLMVPQATAFENGYDRPGGQLVDRRAGVSNPQACQQLCAANPGCVAFTWVKPGIQGPTGMCWMKGSLSNKVRNDCCVSGVVRAVRRDPCKWYVRGNTYTCHCQNSQTGKWYVTNSSACSNKPKPNVQFGDTRTGICPPGQVWDSGTGVFGQGSGGCRPAQ